MRCRHCWYVKARAFQFPQAMAATRPRHWLPQTGHGPPPRSPIRCPLTHPLFPKTTRHHPWIQTSVFFHLKRGNLMNRFYPPDMQRHASCFDEQLDVEEYSKTHLCGEQHFLTIGYPQLHDTPAVRTRGNGAFTFHLPCPKSFTKWDD